MIEWGQYNKYNFPFQLRQSPGDGNSLGRIKFHMPNPYAIYLHDTPAQGLFEQPVRDFSSGCVRVQDIRGFVHQLLPQGDLETASSFTSQLESRESSYFRLANPIDVFLVYFTAWVDPAGQIQFRPDIYDLDRPLILSLQQLYPSQDKKNSPIRKRKKPPSLISDNSSIRHAHSVIRLTRLAMSGYFI